jgi:hypothetical protein
MTGPETKRDAYTEALIIQNFGGECPHCGSLQGHYAHCALIDREAAEQLSRERAEESSIDAFFLRSLRIEAF